MKCSVCDSVSRSLGFCEKHYIRFRKYGDPHGGKRNHGTLEERFWPKVQKSDGCWLWAGAKSSKGYGLIGEGGRNGRDLLAHRVSYQLQVGEIPDGLSILHSCDTPLCVNPAHLRCGTTQENIAEAYEKKRKASPFADPKNRYQGPRTGLKGAANTNARLTDDDIRAIRLRTDKPRFVAKDYNITSDYVTMIRKRKVWKHVD